MARRRQIECVAAIYRDQAAASLLASRNESTTGTSSATSKAGSLSLLSRKLLA